MFFSIDSFFIFSIFFELFSFSIGKVTNSIGIVFILSFCGTKIEKSIVSMANKNR